MEKGVQHLRSKDSELKRQDMVNRKPPASNSIDHQTGKNVKLCAYVFIVALVGALTCICAMVYYENGENGNPCTYISIVPLIGVLICICALACHINGENGKLCTYILIVALIGVLICICITVYHENGEKRISLTYIFTFAMIGVLICICALAYYNSKFQQNISHTLDHQKGGNGKLCKYIFLAALIGVLTCIGLMAYHEKEENGKPCSYIAIVALICVLTCICTLAYHQNGVSEILSAFIVFVVSIGVFIFNFVRALHWRVANWIFYNIQKCLKGGTCEAVKTEYFACLGSSVTLRCKVERVQSGMWKCPQSIELGGVMEDGQCLLKIQHMTKDSVGEYKCICEASGCTSETIVLRILKPTEKQVFENDNVSLDNPTQDKEYKWTHLTVDLIPTGPPTIRGFKKENEDIYICRDKETDEQLVAYHLTTKYRLKVNFEFFSKPTNEDLRTNLISGTQHLLNSDPTYEVTILPTEKHTEVAEPRTVNVVAYLIQERNETEYKEMKSKFDDPSTVFVLFRTGDRDLPNIPFVRKHIAIRYRDYIHDVTCAFYDGQKAVWDDLLLEFTDNKK